MRKVKGEEIVKVVRARRKGRREGEQTEFEFGVGYCVDENNQPTGEVRFRIEQIDSGVAPVVGTLDPNAAEEFCTGLIDSITIADRKERF